MINGGQRWFSGQTFALSHVKRRAGSSPGWYTLHYRLTRLERSEIKVVQLGTRRAEHKLVVV